MTTSAQLESSDWNASAAQGAGEVTQFVSFAIGDDQYGVDIMSVREIRGWAEITHLPKQPEYVRGVLNLRGAIVPIIDLRCRFGGGLTEATPLHVVIIVQIDDRQVGLLADRVLDIVAFESSQVQPVPHVSCNSRTEFLSGLLTVEGGMIAMIYALAVEMARYKVTANVILPGWIETAMTERTFAWEKFANAVMPRIPARRWGGRDDFGGIAVYLLSDASDYHSGDTFVIDGGYHRF